MIVATLRVISHGSGHEGSIAVAVSLAADFSVEPVIVRFTSRYRDPSGTGLRRFMIKSTADA